MFTLQVCKPFATHCLCPDESNRKATNSENKNMQLGQYRSCSCHSVDTVFSSNGSQTVNFYMSGHGLIDNTIPSKQMLLNTNHKPIAGRLKLFVFIYHIVRAILETKASCIFRMG